VFLVVFYCGGSFCGFAVYRELVLLYDRYLPLMSARYMLALTTATPGMPYAVHMRALGMSTSGRSRSRVKPAVGSVRTQVALTARVPTPPTRSTAAPRMPRHPRWPAWARDLFFLMDDVEFDWSAYSPFRFYSAGVLFRNVCENVYYAELC
jgi:hypothetical protein